jgi:peptide-methionine (S)-S-oxide reductase
MIHKDSIVLGGGCFWCLDALYRRVSGVTEVISGYAGGTQESPAYWDLHKPGNTHAEVVKVSFDTEIIDLPTILEIFWVMHNPTTLNQQGNDIGIEYRSIILYNSANQKKVVEDSVQHVATKLWEDPITTEIAPLVKFWPAEEEHQDYFHKNPEQGYCQIIINPKVAKLKKKFTNLIAEQ